MITDSRSGALLTGFFGDWLFLNNLPKVKPDPAVFPEFDENLRQAFRRETELFLASPDEATGLAASVTQPIGQDGSACVIRVSTGAFVWIE
jgi:hypothetical protein